MACQKGHHLWAADAQYLNEINCYILPADHSKRMRANWADNKKCVIAVFWSKMVIYV